MSTRPGAASQSAGAYDGHGGLDLIYIRADAPSIQPFAVSGLLHTLQGKPSGGAHHGSQASHSSGKLDLGKKIFKEGQSYLNKYQQSQKPPGQQVPGQPMGAYGGQRTGVQQGTPGAGPQCGAPFGYPL